MPESGQVEEIVTELESMTRRTYGQFCGLSRALEVVGERWALLIIRDLLVGPRRVADLRTGLPLIPEATLTRRLREFEYAGVVRPVTHGNGSVYELTDFGRELDEIVLGLGRWGARLLGDPRPEEIVTADSVITALCASFRPAAATGLRAGYEPRLGEIVCHARVDDGTVRVAPGQLPDADVVLEPGAAFKGLITDEIDPVEALRTRQVRYHGDPGLAARFTELFRLGG